MFSVYTCLRGSRSFVGLINVTGRTFSQRSISNFQSKATLLLTRTFRTNTSNHISMRDRFGRSQTANTIKADRSAISIPVGRLGIAVGAAVGLGGMCLYGLRSCASTETDAMSAFDRASIWPDYVRQRVRMTYAYLAGGVVIAAGSALALSRSPIFTRFMMRPGWLAPIAMMAGSMGAGVICQMIPYPASGGIGTKQMAWAVFAASIGGMLMPVCLIGGPILTQAAAYSGAIVGSLSIVAATAPSDRFLNWGGPLAMGLGVIVLSSLGSIFLSPVSRLGSGMAVISLYGGLILFSGFLLYDTQQVIKRAETHPVIDKHAFGGFSMAQHSSIRPFDPINNSIHILMDVVNIFVRMVAILSGGQRKK